MKDYEIRILQDDLSVALIVERRYLSNNAAIRSAQKLAGTRQFEIWTDANCIYGVSKPIGTGLGASHAAR